VTFTRASTANYTDINGVAQTAAVNQPRLEAGGLMLFNAASAGAIEFASVSDMSWYNAAAGTFLVEFSVPTVLAATQTMISVDDTTSDERITLRSASGGALAGSVTDGAVSQAVVTGGTISAATVHKFVFAYSANSFAGARDGNVPATDSAGTIPTVTRMTIGSRLAGAENLMGHIRRIRYWPTRKTNAEVRALSN
jgi:hypothetical protein